MTVILVNEDCHGIVAIALEYQDAVDALIELDWLYEDYDIYDEKSDEYYPIKMILGADWEEKVASWNIAFFNEFFEGSFYLEEKEVHKRMGC